MNAYNVAKQKEGAVRYRRIKKLRDKGLTMEEIAATEKCSKQRVQQILKRGEGV